MTEEDKVAENIAASMPTNYRAQMQRCTYCLGAFSVEEITEDHVIARSWYPANTPPVSKWKVPACEDCNNKYSALEGDVLGRLALSLDPTDSSIRRIVDRILRSANPKHARDNRDMVHRLNRRLRLRQDMLELDNPFADGILPHSRRNFLEGSRTGITITAESLEKLVEKWVRGIHYSELGILICRECNISVMFIEDEDAQQIFGAIIQHATRIQKGPGVEVLMWHCEEDGDLITMYALSIWQQFTAYATVECSRSG